MTIKDKMEDNVEVNINHQVEEGIDLTVSEKKVDISISPDDESYEEEIYDVDVVDTVIFDSDMHEYISGDINGYLEGIYIYSNNPCYISAYSEKTKQVILDNQAFQGEKYYPVRTLPYFPNSVAERFPTLIGEKICLNEKVIFHVQGQLDLQLKIVCRYC